MYPILTMADTYCNTLSNWESQLRVSTRVRGELLRPLLQIWFPRSFCCMGPKRDQVVNKRSAWALFSPGKRQKDKGALKNSPGLLPPHGQSFVLNTAHPVMRTTSLPVRHFTHIRPHRSFQSFELQITHWLQWSRVIATSATSSKCKLNLRQLNFEVSTLSKYPVLPKEETKTNVRPRQLDQTSYGEWEVPHLTFL